MIEEKVHLKGVGLFILSSHDRVLVMKELESKPLIQKLAGMLTIPFETMEPDETPDESLVRLIHEEVGVTDITVGRKICDLEFSYPGCDVVIHTYLATTTYEFRAEPSDSDVAYHDWMRPSILIKQPSIRREVPAVIAAYENTLRRTR